MVKLPSGVFLLSLLLLSITESAIAATAATAASVTSDVTTTESVTAEVTTTNAAQDNAATTKAVITNDTSNNTATDNPKSENSTTYGVTTDKISIDDVTTKNVTTDPAGKKNDDNSTTELSDARIVVIILASLLGVVFLFLFLAACAWLISNSARKNRYGRYRGRRRRRRYDFETYPSSEPSSNADEIYVPFDGPPEVTSSHRKSSALEPYYSLPPDTKYSPYLFDDDMGQYMKGDLNPYRGYDLDRPYFSSTGLKPPYDNFPADWYRSMPVNLELALPRPWLR